jgi:V8-like Glu-specific endopeptidase
MGIQARSVRGRAVTSALVLATAMVAAGGASASASAAAGTAGAGSSGASSGKVSAVVHRVGAAAESATRAYWTASRMAAASSADGSVVHLAAGAPADAPTSTHFDGVRTVGALFDTTGKQDHFCTASVVNSATADIVITAAHCVYGTSYATNIEFVPGYHRGNSPYGAWPVSAITVASGWMKSNAQNLDFAFLTVTPPPGTTKPIQFVTGGLWLGINTGYDHPIEAIGYNDTGDLPIKCATNSFKYSTHQMKFFCRGFWNGTSGGPWIVNYNGHTGSGTIIGDIGGFEQGGDFEWASYSVYYTWPTWQLFLQAQGLS